MRHPAQKLNRYKSFVLKLGVSLILVMMSWSLYTRFFLVSETVCTFGSDPCPTAVLDQLERQKNVPVTSFDSGDFSNQVKQLSPFFSSVSVETGLPGKIDVEITPAVEIAEVSVSSQSAGVIVTDTLMITRGAEGVPTGLTKVYYPGLQQSEVGTMVTDETLSKAIELLKKLKENFIAVESLEVESNKISARMSEQTTIHFGMSKEFEQQIRAVQLILNKSFEQPIQVIDVRFEKPTITFVQ